MVLGIRPKYTSKDLITEFLTREMPAAGHPRVSRYNS